MTNEINNTYWTVEEIRPHIIKYLKEKFPDSIIKREFDHVDIMILGPNIPVEIQRTHIDKRGGNPHISGYEDIIRRQIEQNIEIFDKCWFYMDKKFLEYLNNGLNSWSSINLDWFYQLHKSNKLKVFTIERDGNIKELEDNDLNFITKFSSTCNKSKDKEHRILERNKSKIAYNVLKGLEFTTDEIDNFYDEYENNHTKGLRFYQWLSKKDDRKRKFSNVLYAIGHLQGINDMLKCVMKHNVVIGSSCEIGIIEGYGKEKNCRISFIDKYNICNYFPGYTEKKNFWDFLRTSSIPQNEFISTIEGKFDYLNFHKQQKNLWDY